MEDKAITIGTTSGQMFRGEMDDENFTILCDYFNNNVPVTVRDKEVRGIMFTTIGGKNDEMYIFLDNIEYYILHNRKLY